VEDFWKAFEINPLSSVPVGGTNPPFTLFLRKAEFAETPMPNNSKTMVLSAGAVLVVVVGLFLFGGGHNDGQPSAPSGPGNPTQTDLGR